MQFCMDWDLFIRLTGTGPSKRIPGPPLADFRQHENAKSQTMLDVNARESALLLAQYSSRVGQRLAWLFRWDWVLWLRYPVVRGKLNQVFGWEW